MKPKKKIKELTATQSEILRFIATQKQINNRLLGKGKQDDELH